MVNWRQRGIVIGLAAFWFFLILTSYYVLKPFRDALGTSQSRDLPNLYLATFVSTLVALGIYSRLVATVGRMRLVFWTYQFFVGCMLAFYLGFLSVDFKQPSFAQRALVASFFVWVSVFNLYVTTLFWSVMADLFNREESKAWFGWIASGGSLGSLIGSSIAYYASQNLGGNNLLLVAVVCLELGLLVAYGLDRERRRRPGDQRVGPEGDADQGTGGTIFDGLILVGKSKYLMWLCLFVLLSKFSATFNYNYLQMTMEAEVATQEDRLAWFSFISFWGQLGSLGLQGLVVGFLMTYLGLRTTLILSTCIVMGYFVWLGYQPTLWTLAMGHLLQQCIGYGLLVPAQNALFSVVSREEKYKSKAFTDTVVFRGSDVLASQVVKGMSSLQLPLAGLSFAILPILGVWTILAYSLGSMFARYPDSSSTKEGKS